MLLYGRRRSRVIAAAAACASLAIALSLSGCSQGPSGAAAAPPAVSESRGPLDAGGLQDPRTPGDQPDVAPATPIGIRIPSLGVDSVLVNLGVDGDGRLEVPGDYDLAGWYAQGVVPGGIGPAIIAGHVDSPTAPAVFARVGELVSGDDVVVAMSDGAELTFSVTGSAQSAKSDFPTSEVYSNVPTPELRLITCAGEFDSAVGHYTDNLIVFAALRG